MLFHALKCHDSERLWHRLEISATEQAWQELVRVCYQSKKLERQEIITGQRKCVNNLQNSLPQDFETNDLAGLQIRQ